MLVATTTRLMTRSPELLRTLYPATVASAVGAGLVVTAMIARDNGDGWQLFAVLVILAALGEILTPILQRFVVTPVDEGGPRRAAARNDRRCRDRRRPQRPARAPRADRGPGAPVRRGRDDRRPPRLKRSRRKLDSDEDGSPDLPRHARSPGRSRTTSTSTSQE
jgi:hypothetical protein